MSKYRWRAFALSVTLAAPMLLGQIAVAQTLPVSAPSTIRFEACVAQDDKDVEAFFDGGYTYFDAKVLSDFWGQSLFDSKARAGAKLRGPVESKVLLGLTLADARAKALTGVADLALFSDAGYSYNDAETLASFWGMEDAYQGKLCIERNLILGNKSLVDQALELSRH